MILQNSDKLLNTGLENAKASLADMRGLAFGLLFGHFRREVRMINSQLIMSRRKKDFVERVLSLVLLVLKILKAIFDLLG